MLIDLEEDPAARAVVVGMLREAGVPCRAVIRLLAGNYRPRSSPSSATTRTAGVGVAVLCGRAELRPDGVRVVSLVERFGEERAMTDARRALEELAASVASDPGVRGSDA